MELLQMCLELTGEKAPALPPGHPLGERLVCPEYSRTAGEVKTYPLLDEERVFALIWNMASGEKGRFLHSTMYPSPRPFAFHMDISSLSLTQLHTHDYIELGFVVRGEFRQVILGKEIVFHEGDLCLIDQNCLHQDRLTGSDAVVLFLGISGSMFREIIAENRDEERITAFLQAALLKQKDVQQYLHFRPGPSGAESLRSCLTLLLQELYEGGAGTIYLRKGLLLRIFRILSTRCEFAMSREQKQTMQNLMLDEILKYMEDHCADVTVRDLADTFHFQEDYFNRLLRKKTGRTYTGCLRRIRLSRAENLLKKTRMSVEEIAEAVGYQNRGFFYRIFQEEYGCTPAVYRERASAM
ncbi:MAG: AraC family transcriptional regulator [bacterium]